MTAKEQLMKFIDQMGFSEGQRLMAQKSLQSKTEEEAADLLLNVQEVRDLIVAALWGNS